MFGFFCFVIIYLKKYFFVLQKFSVTLDRSYIDESLMNY